MKRATYSLLIEIRSGSVLASAFADGSLQARAEAGFRSGVESAMAAALDAALGQIQRSHPHVPKTVDCLVGSPWAVSQTRSIHTAFPKRRAVKPSLVSRLIADERAELAREIKGGAFRHVFDGPTEILEHAVASCRFDGKEADPKKPAGALRVDIDVHATLVGARFLKLAKEKIAKHFGAATLRFGSSAFVATSARAAEKAGKGGDLLTVDVGDRVTDIGLVRKGVLFQTVSLPIGSGAFLERVAAAFGASPAQAMSYLRLHSDPAAAEALRERVALAAKGAAAEWKSAFETALKELSVDLPSPEGVRLTVEQGLEKLFRSIINTREKR